VAQKVSHYQVSSLNRIKTAIKDTFVIIFDNKMNTRIV